MAKIYERGAVVGAVEVKMALNLLMYDPGSIARDRVAAEIFELLNPIFPISTGKPEVMDLARDDEGWLSVDHEPAVAELHHWNSVSYAPKAWFLAVGTVSCME